MSPYVCAFQSLAPRLGVPGKQIIVGRDVHTRYSSIRHNSWCIVPFVREPEDLVKLNFERFWIAFVCLSAHAAWCRWFKAREMEKKGIGKKKEYYLLVELRQTRLIRIEKG